MHLSYTLCLKVCSYLHWAECRSVPSFLCRGVSHLVEAPRCAVFAAWREVPQLDVQQVHQLDHGLHRVGDVPRLKIALGLLRQLPGDDCGGLSSF